MDGRKSTTRTDISQSFETDKRERTQEAEIMRKPNREPEALGVLRRLVFKIDAERRRGTPLHAKGHPDCEWDDDYPAQLREARDLIDEIDFRVFDE